MHADAQLSTCFAMRAVQLERVPWLNCVSVRAVMELSTFCPYFSSSRIVQPYDRLGRSGTRDAAAANEVRR